MSACQQCGAPVEEGSRYCSVACSNRGRARDWTKTIGPDGERTCRVCKQRKTGNNFPMTQPGRSPERECPQCKRERDNARNVKRRAGKPSQALPPRTTDGIHFWCPRCKQHLHRDEFHKQKSKGHGVGSICKTCRAIDRNAARAKVRIVVAKPAPLYHIKKPKQAVPTGDPAAMRYPAAPCDAMDGYALAIHLHHQGLFAPFVRGWFTSVGEHAERVVQPRFETPGLARLWTEMLDLRTGARR